MRDYFFSDARYLELNVDFPYEEMLKEATALKDQYVGHRSGYEHKGWKSLVLHGLGEDKTESWHSYGFKNSQEASNAMHWTEVSQLAPVTKNYFINHFPCQKYGRVRFMMLEAGGHIDFHTDSRAPIVDNISFCLNKPEGFIWKWGDGHEDLYMGQGKAYAMNISYSHGLVNNSNEDRYHIIVARHDSTNEWKKLMTDAAQKHNVIGTFQQINELP